MTKNRIIETLFQAAAAIFCVAAVYFWSEGLSDRLYLSVVFGCVCFFVSIRFQVKERIRIREEERISALQSGEEFEPARVSEKETELEESNGS